MKKEELTKFVDWLIKSEEAPKGYSFEETVSWVNELASTNEGKKILNKLINTYKSMNIFKDGGKLKHLLCLKSGGKGPDCGCNKAIKAEEGATFNVNNLRSFSDQGRDGTVNHSIYGTEGNDEIRISDYPNGDKLVTYGGEHWVSPGFNSVKGYGSRSINDLPEEAKLLMNEINLQKKTNASAPTPRFGIGGKQRRVDASGYASKRPDGTLVLTQDAVGIQGLPGSNYQIPGSSPEFETHITYVTDKGGNKINKRVRVYNNDGDHMGPIAKYQQNWPDNRFKRDILKLFGWDAAPDEYWTKVANAEKANFKTGGVLFAKEGAVAVDDEAKYQKARNYYARHSDSDTIKKIQQFLIGKGYYGDFNKAIGVEDDGIFGRKTYNAIVKYQQNKGLVDDGMWGEDTNGEARLLNATNSPYRNDSSGTSGAHRGYIGSGKYEKPIDNSIKLGSNSKYQDIYDMYAKALSDTDWFWSDAPDATQMRQFFNQKWKNPNEAKLMEDLLSDIYVNTSSKTKASIDSRKLPAHIVETLYNKNITDGTGEFADFAVKKALPAITTIMTAGALSPLTAAGGIAGGIGGGLIGRKIGEDLAAGETNVNYLDQDELGNNVSVVYGDPEKYYGDRGAFIGNIFGSVAGGLTSNYFGKPSVNGMVAEYYKSPRLMDSHGRLLKPLSEYKYIPRTSHPRGPRSTTTTSAPPTILFRGPSGEPFINFENLSRVKKNGGKL